MKLKCVVLIAIIALLLCGCSVRDVLQDSNNEYTVSSIGFDTAKNGITVYFETLVVNSENAENKPERTIFEGKGASVSEAVCDTLKKTAAPLNLSHAAIVFLQSGVPKDIFWEIYNYCRENNQISVAIGFVLCEDVKDLLKNEPTASLSVGYDIAYMLKTQSERTESGYNNRLYECERRISAGYWRLPNAVSGRDEFYLDGTGNQGI